MGARARRVHATDEPADARRGALIEPGPAPKLTRWRAHRCASHLGRPTARWGTTRARAWDLMTLGESAQTCLAKMLTW